MGGEIVQRAGSGLIRTVVIVPEPRQLRLVLTAIGRIGGKQLQGSTLELVATDGRRLARDVAECDNPGGVSMKAIVPTKGLQQLDRTLGEPAAPVFISVGNNHFRGRTDGVTVVSRLVEGTFPGYQEVIPASCSHQATLARGDRVRVVPGNPAASELLRRIRGQSRERMPLDGPPYLDAGEIRLIEDWIAQGAADSEGRPAPVPSGARVRLHGRLTTMNRLDDLEFVIGAHTRLDKNPRPGDYVRLRGRIDSAGRVIVDRLRRRNRFGG